MKGFKKLALVAAIAAPLTSVHALEFLDDSVLSSMTGQSGVSIDLETQVSISEFTYTDEGSVSFTGIEFGGAGNGTDTAGLTTLDDVKIDIDVNAAGDLVIHLGTQNENAFLAGIDVIDFGFAMSGMSLKDDTGATGAQVLGATFMEGSLGPIDVIINNGPDANGANISVDGYFQITDGGVTVPMAGMSISGLKIYQDANANAAHPLAAAGTASVNGNAGQGFVAFGLDVATADTTYTVFDKVNGTPGADVNVTDALALTVRNFNADIDMDVALGTVGTDAATIGSFHIENLDVSGTKLTIYGH